MSVNIGVAIQRVENKLRRLYDANGDYPDLVAAFVDNYYRKANGNTTISQLINHSRAGNATMTDGYGPELVTNGSFTSDSNWTKGTGWSISGGKAICSGVQTGNSDLEQPISFGDGKSYVVELTVTRTAGVLYPKVGDTTGTGISSSGSFTQYIVAGAGANLELRADVNFVGSVDNVSVREMPVIKWAPHNLLTYSEDFTQWSFARTTATANQATSPNGEQTADYLEQQSGQTNGGSAYQFVSVKKGKNVISVFAKAVEKTHIRLYELLTNGTAKQTWFDIQNGVVGTTDSAHTATITDIGNNWYLCKIEIDATADTSNLVAIYLADSDNSASVTDSGGVYLWGAHLYRSDLGGMADNPDRGDSYVPTAIRTFGSQIVENGTFNTDVTGWTETSVTTSVSASGVEVTTTSTDKGGIVQALSLVVGQRYALSLDYTGSNDAIVQLGNASFSGNTYQNLAVDGPLEISFVAGYATTYVSLRINNASSGQSGTFDNVSVLKNSVDPSTARYLPRIGHHVYNGSAWVNEGLLAESEARTNIVNYSNDFTVANWSKSNVTVTSAAGISPDGNNNAFKFSETTATSVHIISNVGSATACYSVFAKAGTNTRFRINSGASGNGYATFNLSDGTIIAQSGTAFVDATMQDYGNGWYRCALALDSSATSSFSIVLEDPSGNVNYTGNTANHIFVYGAQVESNVATPSSYIPTPDTTDVTRAAETFTIPSANLPWPDPVYIGSELVTNGTFDTDTTGWTASNATLSVESGELKITSTGGNRPQANQTITTTVDRVYEISAIARTTSGSGDCEIEISGIGSGTSGRTSNTTNTRIFHVFRATASSHILQVKIDDAVSVAGDVVYFDNVSVREINPLSVSIAMDGRVTYADTGDFREASFLQWVASPDSIELRLNDAGGFVGKIQFLQNSSGVTDLVETGDVYSPDILVPYSIAQRSGSTFINGATDGVKLTANTTPTELPDLSAGDLNLAYEYMGTIKLFRIWNEDLGDDGIVAATNPSTEPSLNLTFDSTQASYVNFEWSE